MSSQEHEDSAALIDIAFSESLNLYCILSDGTWIGVVFPEAPYGTH